MAYTGQVSKVKGTGYNQVSTPTMSPEQMQLFSSMMGGSAPGISSGLNNMSQMAQGGSPEFWEQLEQPAWNDFNKAQGQLASRFSGMGMGGRKSSGFSNASGGMAGEFSQKLQSRRMQMQQQAIKDLLGLGRELFSKDSYDTQFIPQKKSFWEEMGPGSIEALIKAGGTVGAAFI